MKAKQIILLTTEIIKIANTSAKSQTFAKIRVLGPKV